jgi:hypothetical protein
MKDERIYCETVSFYIIAPYLIHEHETPEGSLFNESPDDHIYCETTVPLNRPLLTSAVSIKPLKGVSSLSERTNTILGDCSFKSSTPYLSHEHEPPEGSLLTQSSDEDLHLAVLLALAGSNL